MTLMPSGTLTSSHAVALWNQMCRRASSRRLSGSTVALLDRFVVRFGQNAARHEDLADHALVPREFRSLEHVHAARSRESDVDDPVNRTWSRSHHHHTVRQEDSLRYAVGDEDHGLLRFAH